MHDSTLSKPLAYLNWENIEFGGGARISNKDSSVGYHEFANTSKTWCLKHCDKGVATTTDGNVCLHENDKPMHSFTTACDTSAAFADQLVIAI